jgi:hypothetical protein
MEGQTYQLKGATYPGRQHLGMNFLEMGGAKIRPSFKGTPSRTKAWDFLYGKT